MNEALSDVSRETMDRLRTFEALVTKWTAKINLISKASQADIWNRHIADSVQLYRYAPKSGLWADLGSGGGFPGIVVAILGREDTSDRPFLLVESDQRKATFLRAAIRELGLNATVEATRIESLAPLNASVLSARALTDLPGLLEFAERHLAPDGTCLFPKGSSWLEEDTKAKARYTYAIEALPSITEQGAAILKIKDVARV